VLNILQNHYPERLGLALILNVPWIVDVFFKMIKPFIDPVTREKMKFNPKVIIFSPNSIEISADSLSLKVIKDGLYTPDMIMTEWASEGRKFEYKHEAYWPTLVEMCDKRKKQQMDKWRELGGTIGLKEWDVRCGDSALANGYDKVEETVSA